MEEEKFERRPLLFAMKTTIGQEIPTASLVMIRAKKLKLPISAVLVPPTLRGYVFIEVFAQSESEGRVIVERARGGVKHSREVLDKPIPFAEIENFMVPKSPVAEMEVGDIVDIIAGPFKGERGRVTRIDREKEEVTVELLEATVPIPLTIAASWVKIAQRKSE